MYRTHGIHSLGSPKRHSGCSHTLIKVTPDFCIPYRVSDHDLPPAILWRCTTPVCAEHTRTSRDRLRQWSTDWFADARSAFGLHEPHPNCPAFSFFHRNLVGSPHNPLAHSH